MPSSSRPLVRASLGADARFGARDQEASDLNASSSGERSTRGAILLEDLGSVVLVIVGHERCDVVTHLEPEFAGPFSRAMDDA